MARLEGKVAAITGATGGIGRAAVRLCADEGARVALVDLDEAAPRRRCSQLARTGPVTPWPT